MYQIVLIAGWTTGFVGVVLATGKTAGLPWVVCLAGGVASSPMHNFVGSTMSFSTSSSRLLVLGVGMLAVDRWHHAVPRNLLILPLTSPQMVLGIAKGRTWVCLHAVMHNPLSET
jgi:hypothetical protein